MRKTFWNILTDILDCALSSVLLFLFVMYIQGLDWVTNYIIFVVLMIVSCTWHPKFIDKFVFKLIKKAANDGKVKRWIYRRDWVFDTVSGIILGIIMYPMMTYWFVTMGTTGLIMTFIIMSIVRVPSYTKIRKFLFSRRMRKYK